MAKSKSKAMTKMTAETRGQLSSNARTKAQKDNDCGADLGKSTTPPTLSGGGGGGIRST